VSNVCAAKAIIFAFCSLIVQLKGKEMQRRVQRTAIGGIQSVKPIPISVLAV
jgi:hypothetical protein